MSKSEVRRAGVLARVEAGELLLVEAAEILDLSYRQTKRIYQRYREEGESGLVHRNAGRPSHHAKNKQVRQRVLDLVRKHYSGPVGERFGPTLAAEHLAEDHGLEIDSETLRRWMLTEGLWSRERRRKAYRKRRARRSHFGELVQMDGSFEHWLENRGPRGCLINMVDDATSKGLAHFDDEETTWAVADTFRQWVEKYGIPRALYVDWKNVYHHAPTERQEREGEIPESQFQAMCRKLGTELIGAGSPQAKGRVERSHGVHQDRLIKKLRLKSIRDYAAANAYLRRTYMPEHNRKFAVAAAHAVDFHEAVPKGLDLNQVFCLEYCRQVTNDWVVQYGPRWLQMEREARVQPGDRITVREYRDGSIKLFHNDREIPWHELPERPKKARVAPKPRGGFRGKPPASHPWRQRAVEVRA